MTYSYFPGCTLKTKAKDLDHYARISAEALGFTLEELPDWQCCGGVYPMAKNEIATKLSSIRALAKAKELGQPLVTLCSACHNVIKQVNHDMQTDDNIVLKANNYLKLAEPYQGETEVLHYLEVLRDKVGFDELKKKVVNPLKGKKIAAYYGCLLLRPGKTMQMDNPENPKILEDFIRAIGATPVLYPMRNECCGGYLTLDEKSVAQSRSNKVMTSAKENGAEMADLKELVLTTSGVNPLKCMRCGKCSGTCPSYDAMEYHPHQFVYMVEKGDIEKLMASKSIYTCLSCFACVERCPRDVEPAKLVEAVRLAVIRQQGQNHLKSEQIPEMLDDDLPQQAIVSAFRKYSK